MNFTLDIKGEVNNSIEQFNRYHCNIEREHHVAPPPPHRWCWLRHISSSQRCAQLHVEVQWNTGNTLDLLKKYCNGNSHRTKMTTFEATRCFPRLLLFCLWLSSSKHFHSICLEYQLCQLQAQRNCILIRFLVRSISTTSRLHFIKFDGNGHCYQENIAPGQYFIRSFSGNIIKSFVPHNAIIYNNVTCIFNGRKNFYSLAKLRIPDGQFIRVSINIDGHLIIFVKLNIFSELEQIVMVDQ